MQRALVVGSGVAGLTAARALSGTHATTLVTKSDLAESNTRYAQGGIAAALPGTDDSPQSHILDTLRAGAGMNSYAAVQALCTDGPGAIEQLVALGVHFDLKDGALSLGREAAHSHARILHAGGDATGAAIERALVDAVRASSCRVLERAFLADLVVERGRAVGVQLIDETGSQSILYADVIVLATGGAGQLYAHTTNPAVTTGDGIAAAWRAGAELADLEFFQFHPTALAVSGSFLVSEAVRGEGAILLNSAGERFMTAQHPDAELAPRDVVARAIALEMAAQGGVPVQLDASALGSAFLAMRFPTIDAATQAAGYNWGEEPVPVTPAAHYWMGGIATDLAGRTSVPGLYAVGEAACTGVHGANRLASNSLLEGLVFASRAVQDITSGHGKRWSGAQPNPWSSHGRQRMSGELEGLLAHREHRHSVDRRELQQLMWESAGVLRSRDGLETAAARLAGWDPAPAVSIADREDANLLQLARLLVDSALAREESRGAHFRSDFPAEVPEQLQGALTC